MTLNQIKATNKDFGANHTIKVSGFKDGKSGPRKPRNKNKMTLVKLAKTVEDLAKIVQDGFAKQEKFNQFVIDQFKEHGWIK